MFARMADAERNSDKSPERQTIPLDPGEKKLMVAHVRRQEGGSNKRFLCAAQRLLNRLPDGTVDIVCGFRPGQPLWDAELAKILKALGGGGSGRKRGRKRG